MTLPLHVESQQRISVEIRVRGRVQGVGFRPAVWRLAKELELGGEVRNDGEGVIIRASGPAPAVDRMIQRLRKEAPPLARIEQIETRPIVTMPENEFRIGATMLGYAATQVAPDAAICPACAREVLDQRERRHYYPFANCTHCGPRLSIVTAIPYDRTNTTMAPFTLCDPCFDEYGDPANRRFHAEAIACPACGPTARLVELDGGNHYFASAVDPIKAAGEALRQGLIVAVKGIGGYQLACDATSATAVLRLRRSKIRAAKPFALMARDLDVVHRYCRPSPVEERLLGSSEAPVVLMSASGPEWLPEIVAPGLRTLGFMLPTTPLHLLMLHRIDRPVVMTSGNISDEPQIVDDREALHSLSGVADVALVNDRKIAVRVDDSVARVMGGVPRLFRRARGYAPSPIKLPAGFEATPQVLALGGDLKSAFCLIKDGAAVLSQHQGELERATTFDDLRRNLSFYAELFEHAPQTLAADRHPEYRSSTLARERAQHERLRLIEVQHHHAHVAACLAENGWPRGAPAVLGIVLDGVGWGEDGTIWGGEFLLAGYQGFERLGTFKPVPMIGGDQAAREPWRNLHAHLMAEMGWAEFSMNFGELEICRYLAGKPRGVVEKMVRNAVNSPLASSCGRLFDAVAAAVGLCPDRQSYEGEAASRLEAIVDEDAMRSDEALAYPFTLPRLAGSGLRYIEPLAMWKALLGDLVLGTPAPVIAARFHKGLARAVSAMTAKLAQTGGGDGPRFGTVALSGGCFQNAILFDEVTRLLKAQGLEVLTHARVPANDGGLALGQAIVAAARLIGRGT